MTEFEAETSVIHPETEKSQEAQVPTLSKVVDQCDDWLVITPCKGVKPSPKAAESHLTIAADNEPVNTVDILAAVEACWYMRAEINEVGASVLIDTGATYSLMHIAIFRKLHMRSLEPCTKSLRMADGTRMDVVGTCQCTLSVCGQTFRQAFIVADLGHLEAIIGMDFMRTNNVVLDAGQGNLRIGELTTTLHPYGETNLVNLIGDTSIQAESIGKTVCQVRGITDLEKEEVWVLEPLESQKGLGVDISVGVVEVMAGRVSVYVMNDLTESVNLKANTTLGLIRRTTLVPGVAPGGDQCQALKANPSMDLVASVAHTEQTSSPNPDQPTGVPAHLEPLLLEADSRLSHEESGLVKQLLQGYEDVFMGPDGRLGKCNIMPHVIDTGENKPIKQPARRLPQKQAEIAEAEVEEMLKRDVIEPAYGPWSSPMVMVRKRDGSNRFCIDLRRVNDVTTKDSYPLPRIDDCLGQLAGAKWFCGLDLASGYWQIELAEQDREKTAFSCARGMFQFKVMCFGLCNAPATFERTMEIALQGLIGLKCMVYLDDIVVFGKSFPETLSNLKEVFERLRKADFKLKTKKCTLFTQKLEILGHRVSPEGIMTCPDKVEAVQAWEAPRNLKELRSFIGFISYYRRYVADFSTVAAPLVNLTRKKVKFHWAMECQDAFEELKNRLTKAPVLAHPTAEDPFILDTDASGFAAGAVLSQVQLGEERVIAFGSKTFSRTQRAYCTTRRELLAVVLFVKYFKYYLWGRHFTIRTDHASLRWLLNFHEPENMLARWLAVLYTYDFQIEHRAGKLHANCDGCPESHAICVHARIVLIVSQQMKLWI